jgi:predicted DNA-binding transcriptional regulator AlpA
MRRYSTVDAAKALGVSYPTLHRWRRDRRFPVPRLRRLGRISVRWWSERDLDRVRRYMEKHYREYRKRAGRRRKLRLR